MFYLASFPIKLSQSEEEKILFFSRDAYARVTVCGAFFLSFRHDMLLDIAVDSCCRTLFVCLIFSVCSMNMQLVQCMQRKSEHAACTIDYGHGLAE